MQDTISREPEKLQVTTANAEPALSRLSLSHRQSWKLDHPTNAADVEAASEPPQNTKERSCAVSESTQKPDRFLLGTEPEGREHADTDNLSIPVSHHAYGVQFVNILGLNTQRWRTFFSGVFNRFLLILRASSMSKGLCDTFRMVKRDPVVHVMVVIPFIIMLATTLIAQYRFDKFVQDIDTAVKCYTMDVNPRILSMNNPDIKHKECYRSQLPTICVRSNGTVIGPWTETGLVFCDKPTAGSPADLQYTVISDTVCWVSLGAVLAEFAIQKHLAWAWTNANISGNNFSSTANNLNMWYPKITGKIYAINHTNPAAIVDAILTPKKKYIGYRKFASADDLWKQIPSTLIVRHCRDINGQQDESKKAGCEFDGDIPVSVIEISHTVESPTKVWLGVKTPYVDSGEHLKSDSTVFNETGGNANTEAWNQGKNVLFDWKPNPKYGDFNTVWNPVNNTPGQFTSGWLEACNSGDTGGFWKVGDYRPSDDCLLVTGQNGYMDNAVASFAAYKTAALSAKTKYNKDSCSESNCNDPKGCLCMELFGRCWDNDAAVAIVTGIWAALVTTGAAFGTWALYIIMFVTIKTAVAHRQ